MLQIYCFNLFTIVMISKLDMQLGQEYIQAYVKFGRQLTHSPLLNSLKSKIVELLPSEDYRALDLGSPSYHYADEIMLNACHQGKRGNFVVVDPFPIDSKVIRATSEEYLKSSCPEQIDLILIKESIHLFPKFKEVMQACHSKLRKNGVIAIFILSKETTLPWTQPLQNSFEKSCFDEQLLQEVSGLFQIECDRLAQQKHVSKENLIGLIKNRGWSNLFKNSNQELHECIEMIQACKGELQPAKIVMAAYYLHKK